MGIHVWRLLPLVLVLAVIGPAESRTWMVELDGSGDFTNIQPAVEAAADGDTVLVGPGRYDQLFTFTTPGGGWTDEVIVGVERLDLTLIGSGIDQTIIGPDAPLPWGMPGPVGIAWIDGRLTISDLTIEHMRDALYVAYGRLEADSINLHHNNTGIVSWAFAGTEVTSCFFLNNMLGINANGIGGTPYLETINCVFRGRIFGYSGLHISAQSLTDVMVDRCEFHEGIMSVQFDSCPGTIKNCVVESGSGPHFGFLGSHTELYDNVVRGDGYQVVATNGGWVVGSGNIFAGDSGDEPTAGAIMVSNVDVALHGNHILKAPGIGYAVKCGYGCDSTIDLSDNYWGPVDAVWLDQNIYDGNDTGNITTIVEYAPFSEVPVPNEDMSWSGLKDLFR